MATGRRARRFRSSEMAVAARREVLVGGGRLGDDRVRRTRVSLVQPAVARAGGDGSGACAAKAHCGGIVKNTSAIPSTGTSARPVARSIPPVAEPGTTRRTVHGGALAAPRSAPRPGRRFDPRRARPPGAFCLSTP